MDYNNIKDTFLKLLEINFETTDKETIATLVDSIFSVYKNLQNFSLQQEYELSTTHNVEKLMGLTYDEVKEFRKKMITTDSIKYFLNEEDLLMSYAYGAYISSKIAHGCYYTSYYSKEYDINVENKVGYFKFFPPSLDTPEIRGELKKYAFALKNMFIKKIIDEGKSKKYSNIVTYSKDANNKPVLSVDITTICDEDGNYVDYRNCFKEICGVISIHVVDDSLMDSIQNLKEQKIEHSMTPQDILNIGDVR